MEETNELVPNNSTSEGSESPVASLVPLIPENTPGVALQPENLPEEKSAPENGKNSTSLSEISNARKNPPGDKLTARDKLSVKNSPPERRTDLKKTRRVGRTPVTPPAVRLRAKKPSAQRDLLEKNQPEAKLAPKLKPSTKKIRQESATSRSENDSSALSQNPSADHSPAEKQLYSQRSGHAKVRSKKPLPERKKQARQQKQLAPSATPIFTVPSTLSVKSKTDEKSLKSSTSVHSAPRARESEDARSIISRGLASIRETRKSLPAILDSLTELLELEPEETVPSSSERESVSIWTRAKPMEVLAALTEIPRLSEISERSSSEIIPIIQTAVDEHEGAFVDALTGNSLTDSFSLEHLHQAKIRQEEEQIDEEQIDEEQIVEEKILEEKIEEKESEDSDLQKLIDADDEFIITYPEENVKAIADDQFLKQLISLKLNEGVDEPQVDHDREDSLKREAVRQSTAQFLDDLINEAAATAEKNIVITQLRNRLNKQKLLSEVQSKLNLLDLEVMKSTFLNRKAVEYHRRKKMMRALVAENTETVDSETEKHKNTINILNTLLGEEVELKKFTKKSLADLTLRHQKAETEAATAVNEFEDLMRTKMQRAGFIRLPEMVEKYLRSMNNVRNEITNERFRLIQIQHTEAALELKLEKKYDLGNGLHLLGYERLQTDVQERNSELTRHRKNCQSHIHMVCHVKEKIQMQRNLIGMQTDSLDELKDMNISLREYLTELKIHRTKLRNELNETSFQGGLLDKPSLMYDYDKTLENIEETRNRVENLKSQIHIINKKIRVMEGTANLKDSFGQKGSTVSGMSDHEERLSRLSSEEKYVDI